MKALILNGEGKDEDLTHFQDAIERLFNDNGMEIESIKVKELDLKYCIGCFNCWIGTPGECIFKDAGYEIARKVINSDILILLTPLTFGGYSPDLKIAVDRFLPLLLPFFKSLDGETHHSMRYDRAPFLIGIGIMETPDPDEEKIFMELMKRNSLNFDFKAPEDLIIQKDTDLNSFSKSIMGKLKKMGVMG